MTGTCDSSDHAEIGVRVRKTSISVVKVSERGRCFAGPCYDRPARSRTYQRKIGSARSGRLPELMTMPLRPWWLPLDFDPEARDLRFSKPKLFVCRARGSALLFPAFEFA